MANLFMNNSGTIGVIYTAFTNNVTGSEFLTLLFIMIFVIGAFMIFRLPMEISILFTLPLVLIMAAYSGEFYAAVGLILLYAGVLLAKYYWV